ncbi:MAG: radical SAM protein [Verrucomicrobia bacterium]|nr:radical SAM protein [Verrucomicrobiota bacterium]
MTVSRVTSQVLKLMEHVTERGPAQPEYDGLRVFHDPRRVVQHLTGRSAAISPVTLDVWPSLTCNARCPLCQYRISGARGEVDATGRLAVLEPALADVIFAGAVTLGVRSVILTGGGEPLLNPHVVDIARSARLHGLRWGLITNGLLLTEPLAAALLSERPAFLRVSLDAGTAETRATLYGTPLDEFERVVRNVAAAAKTARRLGVPAFGVSFALPAATAMQELREIRNSLERILALSDGSLPFVVFRPRLRHYVGAVPVCPQPQGKLFPELARGIAHAVVEPIKRDTGDATRFDIKEGLFLLASRDRMARGCLSASWMTTITHEGEGYVTGELAGAKDLEQCWGRITTVHDFSDQWRGKRRRALHEAVHAGSVPVPIVHRTSPIDEFLRRLDAVTGGVVDDALAAEILGAVKGASWYRSKRSDFV